MSISAPLKTIVFQWFSRWIFFYMSTSDLLKTMNSQWFLAFPGNRHFGWILFHMSTCEPLKTMVLQWFLTGFCGTGDCDMVHSHLAQCQGTMVYNGFFLRFPGNHHFRWFQNGSQVYIYNGFWEWIYFYMSTAKQP